MIAYISSFFNYIFSKRDDSVSIYDDSDADKEAFLAEQLVGLQVDDNEDSDENYRWSDEKNSIVNLPRNAKCFQKTGIIKYIDEKCVMIHGTLYFNTTTCPHHLCLNDKVLYLGYNNEGGSEVVVRILENHGGFWGDNEQFEEENYKVIEHIFVAEVGHRENRLVFIKDSPLNFDLDNVQASLVPVSGDWLEMTCNVKYDQENPSVSIEQVLQVVSIKPLRSKIMSVVISEWTGEYGICNKQIFFNRQCLMNALEPTIGSKALVEVIESNQGTCTWRVIKMDILETTTPETGATIAENKQDNTLEIERNHQLDITYPLQFEKLNINDRAQINLSITNNGHETHIINKWIVLSKKKDSQVDISPFLSRPKKLYPGQTFCITITSNPKFYGNSKEHLIIMFKGFQVKRIIEINIQHEIISNSLSTAFNIGSKSNIDKIERMKKMRQNGRTGSIVLGEKLLRPPNFVPVKLGSFPIPDRVWSAILGDSKQSICSTEYNKIIYRIESQLPCLLQNLNITNYIDRWHTLLYMEEIQMNINIRSYDMPKVFLTKCQEYLTIEINSLAEKRPSIIKGDRVIVKDIWDTNGTEYEGYIHLIKGDMVMMKFHQRFHETYSGSDVSIEFHFIRSIYRRAHQAINLALTHLGPDVLFPSRVTTRPHQIRPDRMQDVQWFNKNLNAGQKKSVLNILLGECRPMPYCIYGPPGTGKTITVIETILQILTHLPDSRILIATPSNSAANLVTERLLQYRDVFSTSIIRLIANYLVDSDNIPEVIKPYCSTLDIAREDTVKSRYTVRDSVHLKCPASFVGRHRITIGTCYCLGSLAQMGLPKGHFTHVIVDEAGQATEPEIMIPLTFVDKENSQIILAGDPMQLGPVINSKYCKEFGMDESYFSRILDTFPYQKDYEGFKDGFNKRLVSRLVDNYRSLQEGIDLPSELFYDASLVAKIDRRQPWILQILDAVSELFDFANEVKTGGIFVHGIRGSNSRAEDSPSWYNPQEASMVALTTCKLYKKNVTADNIGIITPYIAQIKYIRLLFDAMGLPQPKIGTVEEFQGQERPLIIISTVRASESLLDEDRKHSLGFVKSPKRMNVALTRAQVATILFCDPHLLSKDPLWLKVINYAIKKDKYLGCDLPKICAKNKNDVDVLDIE